METGNGWNSQESSVISKQTKGTCTLIWTSQTRDQDREHVLKPHPEQFDPTTWTKHFSWLSIQGLSSSSRVIDQTHVYYIHILALSFNGPRSITTTASPARFKNDSQFQIATWLNVEHDPKVTGGGGEAVQVSMWYTWPESHRLLLRDSEREGQKAWPGLRLQARLKLLRRDAGPRLKSGAHWVAKVRKCVGTERKWSQSHWPTILMVSYSFSCRKQLLNVFQIWWRQEKCLQPVSVWECLTKVFATVYNIVHTLTKKKSLRGARALAKLLQPSAKP